MFINILFKNVKNNILLPKLFPKDLSYEIAKYLSGEEVINYAKIVDMEFFNSIQDNENFWKTKCQNEYSNEPKPEKRTWKHHHMYHYDTFIRNYENCPNLISVFLSRTFRFASNYAICISCSAICRTAVKSVGANFIETSFAGYLINQAIDISIMPSPNFIYYPDTSIHVLVNRFIGAGGLSLSYIKTAAFILCLFNMPIPALKRIFNIDLPFSIHLYCYSLLLVLSEVDYSESSEIHLDFSTKLLKLFRILFVYFFPFWITTQIEILNKISAAKNRLLRFLDTKTLEVEEMATKFCSLNFIKYCYATTAKSVINTAKIFKKINFPSSLLKVKSIKKNYFISDGQ